MTIYVDQMFLENFIMNFIILYLTSKFSGVQGKWYRLSIGAIIGALYVIGSYIFGFYDGPMIGIKILLAVTMVITSFRIRNIKEFLKVFTFFFGITLLIGGASFGIAFFTNAYFIAEGGVLYVEEFPILLIAIGTTISIIIINWICVFLKRKINLKQLLYNIDIKIFDKKISTVAFLDSGHSVKERFSGYPVIIVERDIFNNLVPDEIAKKVYENDFSFEEKWRKRLRIIPISTLNTEHDILIGFKADEGIIHIDSGDKHIEKLIVAGCDRKLDKENNYFALMGNIIE